MSIGNTAKRVLVALVAIPAIVLVCYLGNIYFLIFVLGIGLISYYEFVKMVENKGVDAQLIMGLLLVLSFILNEYLHFAGFYFLITGAILLLTFVELFRNKGSAVNNLGATVLGALYIGIFSSAIVGIREFFPAQNYVNGGYLIITILATIWVCDSAAFFGGTALGKHKLFPRISPNKSWEGALFGLSFSIITMVISKVIIIDFLNWKDVIILGLIVGIIGQTGDLIESMFKRDTGVKDSSGLIPGHGGIFDRFDSLLYTSPAIFLYLNYIYRF